MIYLRNIREIGREPFDQVWLVVRSLGTASGLLSQSHIVHVPELSPEWPLFFSYRRWAKNGEWNLDTFRNRYVPVFLEGAKKFGFQKAWERLKEEGATKDICLACFCPDEALCHRSILGAMACKEGIPVEDPVQMEAYAKRYGL